MGSLAALKGTSGLLSVSNNFRAPDAATQEQTAQAYRNTQSGLQQQQDFINAVNAQNGLGNQANVFAQQQALANQFQGVANGTGPNPALAQLNQTTGANVANQAALMAGQRGAGANVGLIGRQAAQQGGALQQQAVGQGATLQAQQQLAALSSLQQQQANMGNLAATQVGQQQNALAGFNQFAQGQQSNLFGALGQQNQLNAGITNANQASQNALTGGLLNAGGQAATMAATGGASAAVPQSKPAQTAGTPSLLPQGQMYAAHGGVVPEGGCASHVTSHLEGLACGGQVMGEGGKVPGKAEVKGDSYANDKVSAVLSPGEIVIPRSILEAKDPGEAAKAFVMAHLGKPGAAKDHFFSGGNSPGSQPDPEYLNKSGMLGGNYRGGKGTNSNAVYVPPVQIATDYRGRKDSVDAEGNEIAPPVQVDAVGPPIASNTLVPGSLPSANVPDNGNISLNPEATPAAPAGNKFQNIYSDQLADVQGGNAQQIAGISEGAAAQGAMDQRNAAAIAQSNKNQQALLEKYNAGVATLDQHRDAFQQDIANTRIDPNRYLGKMDTTGKVMTGIGLLLSGIGSGLAHQDNMASKFLQTQIDHDIDAQKADLGKKENLLSANMKQYGNLKDGVEMTRVMMNDTLIKQLQESAAKSGDAMAQARAQAEIGKLRSDNAKRTSEVAVNNALFSGPGGDNPSMVLNAIPGAQGDAARKEFKEASELQKKRDAALAGFDKVAESATAGFKLKNPRKAFSGSQGEQLNASIAELAKDTTGRYNAEEAKSIQDQFKPKMSDTPEDLAMKRRAFSEAWNQKASFPTLSMYGVNPLQSARFDQSGQSRIKEGKPKF